MRGSELPAAEVSSTALPAASGRGELPSQSTKGWPRSHRLRDLRSLLLTTQLTPLPSWGAPERRQALSQPGLPPRSWPSGLDLASPARASCASCLLGLFSSGARPRPPAHVPSPRRNPGHADAAPALGALLSPQLLALGTLRPDAVSYPSGGGHRQACLSRLDLASPRPCPVLASCTPQPLPSWLRGDYSWLTRRLIAHCAGVLSLTFATLALLASSASRRPLPWRPGVRRPLVAHYCCAGPPWPPVPWAPCPPPPCRRRAYRRACRPSDAPPAPWPPSLRRPLGRQDLGGVFLPP